MTDSYGSFNWQFPIWLRRPVLRTPESAQFLIKKVTKSKSQSGPSQTAADLIDLNIISFDQKMTQGPS